MKHWKDDQGREKTEQIDVEPQPVPSPEEFEAEEGRKETPEPPPQGPVVDVDPHWVNLKLPDHPRNEGWL
ncbi:MAG TPA: hypothetical protein V6D47_09520 [Oscillatoriaceae cyanobacterium]